MRTPTRTPDRSRGLLPNRPRGLRTGLLRGLTVSTVVAALATGLTACGGDSDAATTGGAAPGTVTVGALSNGAARQTDLKVTEVKAISAELRKSVARKGSLVIGVGALPAGFPPLAYVGQDQKTLTGAEPDLGRLVAAVLGLKPEVKNSTWESSSSASTAARSTSPSRTSPTPRSARRSTSSPPTGRTTSPSRCGRRAPGTSAATTGTWPA